MTVANNVARNQYVATGGQTVFSYTFEITDTANIYVWQRAGSATPDDAADLLTYLTDYTLTGVGAENGGTVVLVAGATVGDIVTMQSAIPSSRDTSFTPSGVIQAEDLNIEFDNQTLIEQRQQTVLNDQTPKYPASAIIFLKDLRLPILAGGQIWQMNPSNTEIIAMDNLESAANLKLDLASHVSGKGASMIGLQNQSNVTSKSVQDFANSKIIVQVNNGSLQNAQALGDLTTGILKSTTTTGILSVSAPLTSIDSLTTSADLMLYTTGSNTYATTSLTAFARTLLDDADAATMRATLGLVIGTNVEAWSAKLDALAAQVWAADTITYQTSTSAVSTTSLTAFARTLIADADAASARSTLGVVIGTNVEAWSAKLDALAAQVWAADTITYQTSSSAVSTTSLTSFGRSLIADADAASARTTIGVVIGTNVEAWSAKLDALAAQTWATDTISYQTSTSAVSTTALTSYARTLIGAADAATARSTLGVVIGTNVEAWSAKLDALAAQTWAADTISYQTSTSAVSTTSLTSFARTLIGGADAATMRSTLGVVIGTNVEAWSAKLDALAAQTWAADTISYQTSTSAVSTTPLTSFMRTLLDDPDAATARSTLGVSASGAALQVANNLSDLNNVATALVNLGLGTPSGTGNVLRQTSPTMITPILGVAQATSISFSSTAGIIGTTTNDSANAGSVGEFISASLVSGSAISLTSTVDANVISISLTAGDWDVWANLYTSTGAGTITSSIFGQITTTSATFTFPPTISKPTAGSNNMPPSGSQGFYLTVGTGRFSLSTTTTIYLVVTSTFSTSTQLAYGWIAARRVR